MAIVVEMELIAPDGASLALDADAGYWVTGLDDGGLPPLEVGRYSLPLQDGAVLSEITAQTRPINVMVQVTGNDYAGMVTKVAALVDIVKPYRLKAPGAERYWILRRTVGTKETDLHVVPAGLIKEGVRGMGRVMGIRLEALDPFWYEKTERTRALLPEAELDVGRIIARDGSVRFEDFGGGLDGRVHAMIEDPATGNIYVGGNFANSISGVAMAYVGMWDGTKWNALGAGTNGIVRAFYWDAATNKLYAGGDFTTAGGGAANYVAVWNGAAWSGLGAGTDATVYALAYDGSFLYLGGNFNNAGGAAAAKIVAYKPSTGVWATLGTGMDLQVSALAWDNATQKLYAGGDFTTAGGGAAKYIAAWNGVAWAAVGGGMDDSVLALALDTANGLLYAGGVFTDAGGSGAEGAAVWDGLAWARLNMGLDLVQCLHYDAVSGILYMGGKKVAAGGVDYVFTATGTTTLEILASADSNVYAVMLTSDRTLITGGAFTTIDGVPVGYIAQWTRRGWDNLAGGMNGTVSTLKIGPDGTLYAGGAFTTAGGLTVNRIARWHGGAWEDLDGGIDNGTVYALAFGQDGTLYAAGTFTAIGGVRINRIAQWDGTAWSAVGTGMDKAIYALAMTDTGVLYAAGEFANAGGGAAKYVAKWDGAVWSALGAGLGNTGLALIYDPVRQLLYAGGAFTTAGGNSAARIAQWNGSAWSALGTGLNNQVNALELGARGLLYVGGAFTTAGGNTAAYLATWNGFTWNAVGGSAGTGLNNTVYDLVYATDGTLYVGGEFTTAGTLTLADYVARWNGYTFAALPFDLPAGYITALAERDGKVYFGGSFNGTAYVAGAREVVNPGGLNTPVVFSIEGPGTLISLRNDSTGKEMWFNLWINAGETVTVNLTPGAIAITSDWRGRLEALPNSAFTLDLAADPVTENGVNVMSVFVLGATADTEAVIAYRVRWYDWENAVQ